ncbi:MFS general substrate transporter [Phialemonium atrogriseum]|uniref:MFS general substrate transporter n=1 Tax=Phialemonium atrogriseum TaxID=1093897 RepID=A0AAJ0FJC0_9PEZI|nr:MFS general substrate transporter [Phialemonium atrogriseum]KAK1764249.1 MFS general substrate transporter [Phialemonium atrogriseum]
MISKFGRYVFHESGLRSVYSTGRDAWLIILCRTCRMFAHGAISLILALFFAELRVSDSHIGLFMTLTLAGDVVLSLALTLVADHVGRRRTLAVGAVLMIMSGTAFALCENYWVLLLAAVVGVISATGGDFGPFRAIEESTLSELTTPTTRPDVLVWYVTTASLGSAVGTEMSGRIVEALRARDGWTLLDAYHACFWIYGVMGATNLLSNMLLSERCELRGTKGPAPIPDQLESEPLLEGSTEEPLDAPGTPKARDIDAPPAKRSRFGQISLETRSIMYALWFLLMVDSLADGMVSMSLTTYYMDQKFHLPKSTLGDVVSASYLLSSCSTIFAGPLARRIGLVNTMVFTHIPSSAAVLLFPLPRTVPLTFALLLVRVGLNNMDQAPRSALIAAVVRPEERTAVMGVTGMLRTLAATAGPSVTGVLAGGGRFWVAYVAAGALRLAYDLGLFAMFINIKLHRHEPVEAAEERGEADEEDSDGEQAGVRER